MPCEQCQKPVSEKVYTFSKNKFGKVLCMHCQNGGQQPKQESQRKQWGGRQDPEAERLRQLYITRIASWNTANALIANLVAAGQRPEGSLLELTKEIAHVIEEDVFR